jgi:hypothetical protein
VFGRVRNADFTKLDPVAALNTCNNATGYNELFVTNYEMHNDPKNKGNYTEGEVANCLMRHDHVPWSCTRWIHQG